MKTRSIQLGRWVAALLLCSLILPATVRAQDPCPCSWYNVAIPNPEWGWPPTLGEMFPVHYYDTESVYAFFLVPLSGLQSLLPESVRPLEATAWLGPSGSGFGMLYVGVEDFQSVEYLGPYKEGQIAIVVDDVSSGGLFPLYVISMILTTEPPVWGGIASYGLPKILGDAHFQSVKPKGMKCFSSADGELIFQMEVATDDLIEGPAGSCMMLSTKEGYLVRTPVVATAGTEFFGLSVGKSTIKLGEHLIAQKLRAIGVGMYPSIAQGRKEHVQTTLPLPTCQPLP